MTYQVAKGEENDTFTLYVDKSLIHIQIEQENRTIGPFEFKQIQRFIILDNEINKKHFASKLFMETLCNY